MTIVNNMTFKIAGEAGQGVESSGAGFAKAFARGGLHIFTVQDFMSRIRGGHNFFQIRVSDSPIYSHNEDLHLLLAFTAAAVEKHLPEIVPGGAVIYDERIARKVDVAAIEGRGVRALPVPLDKIAKEQGGDRIMSNTAAVAAAGGLDRDLAAPPAGIDPCYLVTELELYALLFEDPLEIFRHLTIHAGRNAVEELDHKRLGTVLVLSVDKKLIGIITDGDIRRCIVKRKSVFELKPEEVMTKNPRTLGPESPAYDALNMMEQHQITVLPITDPGGMVRGVLHLHDILGKGDFKFNGC